MWGYMGGSSLYDAMNPYRQSPYAPSAPDEPALLSSISQLSADERERLKKMGWMGMGGKFANAAAAGERIGSIKGQNPWVAALVAGLGTGISAYMDEKGSKAALEADALDKANRSALQDYGLARNRFNDETSEFRVSEGIRREQEKAAEERSKARAESLEALKEKQRMDASLRRLGAPDGVDSNSPEAKIVLEQLARQAVKPKDDPKLTALYGHGEVRFVTPEEGKTYRVSTRPDSQANPGVEDESDWDNAAAAIDSRITSIMAKDFPKPEDAAFLASVKTPEQRRAAIAELAQLRQRIATPLGGGSALADSISARPQEASQRGPSSEDLIAKAPEKERAALRKELEGLPEAEKLRLLRQIIRQ